MLENLPDREALRKMDKKELKALAADIREFIIEKTSEKGGHLASNLGTVELTLALFSVFDFPKDKVIWDVGHQAYTYKLLSGRKEGFDSLRELHGMSGFPKRNESEYDCFNTGHSSTSLSAGIGMVTARELTGGDYHVISVIGDGSMTGGMAFEALNNASRLKSNFIMILNDNEMSISKNVGGLKKYLTGIRAGKGYNRVKTDVKQSLSGIPGVGEKVVSKISGMKDGVKELLLPNGMFFENIDITYLGPVDGHNVEEMKKIFERAKDLPRSVIIHVLTKKGKGYEPAEAQPDKYHGVEPFDIETGLPKKEKRGSSYSSIFGTFMKEAGEREKNLTAITAAMCDNVGLDRFEEAFPERFFDVGIAEQHAVTFAAGQAVSGLHPVVAVFSSFLQRAYDQIVHDVCMQDLPVTFAVDRAGVVGKDGETHQGAFDISFMTSFPGMTVMAPKTGAELRDMLDFAVHYPHPVTVRYPRGTAFEGLSAFRSPIEYGKAEVLVREHDIALLAFGDMVETACNVQKRLHQMGKKATVINLRFAKPLDTALLKELTRDHSLIVTMEDGILSGGVGEKIADFYARSGSGVRLLSFGIDDIYVPQGAPNELKAYVGIDEETVTEKILKELR